MVSEKLIVILLVLSIVLSVGSIVLTTSLNLDSIKSAVSGNANAVPDFGASHIGLNVVPSVGNAG
jgi:hypothetical protein